MTGPNDTQERIPHFLWWNVIAGAIFVLAAMAAILLFGIRIGGLFDATDGQVTWPTYFAGVFLTGCTFWWLLMSRPQRLSPWRGAVTGVVVALFSYPAVLLLTEIFNREWTLDAGPESLIGRLTYVLLVSGLTLLTTGFAATLIMAATGAVTAWLLVRMFPETAALAAHHARQKRGGLVHTLVRIVAGLATTAVIVLAATFALLTLLPINSAGLAQEQAARAPTADYAGAMTAFAAVEAAEQAGVPLNALCHSKLLTHGARTAKVVVFFHGLTNCPAQGDELAQQLFDLGYNVYLPRLPGHGEADPMTLALANLTAEALAASGRDATDLAQGLGDEVVVAGLSVGGTVTAGLGQYRADISDSISLAPFLAPYVVPPWAAHAATNLILMAPNFMVWWDAQTPYVSAEMPYAYPRFATHAIGQAMRLGLTIEASAHAKPAEAKALGMLLNDADVAVSNLLAEQLVTAWENKGRTVEVEVFPKDLKLPHDLIDPRQEDANIAVVYPKLIEMIAR